MKKTIIAVIAALLLVAGGFCLVWANACKSFLTETIVSGEYIIENGYSYKQVRDILFGGYKLPEGFDAYLTKLRQVDKRLHYGYYLADNISLDTLLENVLAGKETLIKVTFPEGYNMYDMAQALDTAGIAKKGQLLTAFRNKDLMQKLLGKQYISFEGFLAPGTYFFPRADKPERIIAKMVSEFNRTLPANFEEQAAREGMTFYEALILASIVQKETYDAEESPLVAAVYLNRFRIRMLLQADPTIIYGLVATGRYDGNIRRRDLVDENNKYNTYKQRGLPPTPICTPSVMSLNAVIAPARVNYFYFVADNNGKHIFAETYAEHDKNVDKYQKKSK
ncbi:hypothetical protein RsTz2092_07830 [Deferribacterales bacterium RsTz2092]